MRFFLFFSSHVAAMGAWAYVVIFLVALLESTAFIGLFMPGTTFAVFTGFLASQGVVDIGDVFVWMALGGIAGDAVSYFLGRSGSQWFREDGRIIKKKYIEQGEDFFRRHGNKSVLLARFVGPFRPVVPFIAGVVRMPRLTFFFYNIIGGVLAALTYTLVGYYFAEAWTRGVHLLGRVGVGAVVLVLLVLLVGTLFDKKVAKKL